MLLKYIVSNFKSIGHPVEFSMFPTQENMDERFLKTINSKAGDWKVLSRGGFFGPNASGKSSFIESLAFAKSFIINGRKSGKGTGVNQFKGYQYLFPLWMCLNFRHEFLEIRSIIVSATVSLVDVRVNKLQIVFEAVG